MPIPTARRGNTLANISKVRCLSGVLSFATIIAAMTIRPTIERPIKISATHPLGRISSMAPPFDASAPDVLALESGVGQSVGGSCDVALIRDLNHIESMAIKCEIPHTARLFFSAGTLMPGAPCQSVRPEDFGTGPCLHHRHPPGKEVIGG